ncbi:MAG: ArnT family glycosyltransferase [Candidatus Levyibacteriota bacterium]
MKKEFLLLILTLVVCFVVRLYRFDNPIADWHSWRQADTSAVSRNFILHGFDLLHPTYDDISNVQTGFDNPKGYRFVEFPIYNFFQAGLYKIIGVLTLEEWGRLVSIITSVFGSLFLYLLVKKKTNTLTAFFVLIFYAFIPYNIYYSRTILPDTSMMAAFLGGLYFLDLWLDAYRKKEYPNIFYLLSLIIALLLTAMSFLLKGYTLFYGLTFLALVFSVFKFSILKKWELWIFMIFSILPFVLWRKYILQFPEGVPANAWLFNGNGIRFRPSFFRWIFYERITKLIAGYVGSLFVVFGIAQIFKEKKNILFFLSFPVSALIYLSVIATGNVQHDYYQIVIMPAVAIVMGFGAVWVVGFLKKYMKQKFAFCVISILILLSFFFAWQQVKDYFNINNRSIVIAGQAVDMLTPKNAKIVAPYNGDTSFLYQTKRKGWPAFEKPLPDLIQLGADYLVLVNPAQKDYNIGKTYKIISATKDYILFDLHQKP